MLLGSSSLFTFFFFNDTATTEIYTLSLHDALPISDRDGGAAAVRDSRGRPHGGRGRGDENLEVTRAYAAGRSEEHTSELQSQSNLVCRLLLEKKKKNKQKTTTKVLHQHPVQRPRTN